MRDVLHLASLCLLGLHVVPDVVEGEVDISNYQCLDDPKTIFYENAPEVEVDILPSVRMMMCGYSSQCALNMVAYLFMKEKLGMNMSFYPTNDYDSVWNGEFWQDWEDPFAYPKFYFEWLYNDSMDLNMEFWPLQLSKPGFDGRADYVLAEANADVYPEIAGLSRIDYGGFVGAYGEISIYIPQYWAEQHPTHLIPSLVATDMEFREALINASAYGPTDYVAMYSDSDAWDTPTYDKPIVWGSVASYSMSEYADGLSKHLGMNVSFVTTGSESSLMDLVADLYSQRKPFLANIYTIDDNFGVTANETTGELQQFEKLAFPRNPDQSVYDPCYVNTECQNPIEPIMKAANPRLKAEYPEAHAFFTGFTMGTRQINQIVSYYLDLKANQSADESHTEVWLEAACQWLKSDDPAAIATWDTSEWLIDVVRKDCLSGCGLPTGGVGSATTGGSCNYYTGDCECAFDELFADRDCKESCPGLVGPNWNEQTDSWTFEWCSGHGTCDTTTRQCECELMYGDEGCGTKYTEYILPLSLQIVISLLSCILAVICILCIVWLRWNKQYKTVKALSIDMTTIMTVGLLMIVLSNITLTQKMSSITCIAWQWLFGLGGILAILSPLLKAYRVSRVFHGGKMLRAVKITEKMLMAMLLKFAAIEVLVCVGYSVLHELMGGATVYYNDLELRTEDQCNDNSITGYVSFGSYAYFFVMLCALTYYSYGTRRALSVFQESTCAYFSSFLSLFCTIIVMVFYAVTDDPTFRTLIQSFAIVVVVSAVLCLFYGTRIYAFFVEPENRDVTDMNQATNSTTHNSQFSPMNKPNSMMKPAVVEDKV